MTDGAKSRNGAQIVHQTGPGRGGDGCGEARGYRAVEFTRDVPALLRAATLVLCRGGASTLAEVAAARVPALVVPYPHHADRHQERNARELGAGVRIVPEAELGEPLARELARLLSAGAAGERAAMRAALARAVPLDGSARALDELARIIHEPASETS